MEKMTSSDVVTIEGMQLDGKTRIFGLARILEAFVANSHRIELFWDIVLAHYVCLANAKNNTLRQQGIENLNTLIEKCFQQYCHRAEKGTLINVSS